MGLGQIQRERTRVALHVTGRHRPGDNPLYHQVVRPRRYRPDVTLNELPTALPDAVGDESHGARHEAGAALEPAVAVTTTLATLATDSAIAGMATEMSSHELGAAAARPGGVAGRGQPADRDRRRGGSPACSR